MSLPVVVFSIVHTVVSRHRTYGPSGDDRRIATHRHTSRRHACA
ncbi:MAG: hypothetical protein SOH65_07275 [Bifidobacterium sp.]